jgi:two-component system sensor histidine kinase/response regulator
MNSLRFLLVDTDIRESERISSVLEEANHTVLPTHGLEEACDALDVERFDAVLLGSPFSPNALLEFKLKLREVEKRQRSFSHIPLLSFLEKTAERNARTGEPAGGLDSAGNGDFDGYLDKPLDPAALTEAVTRLAQAVAHPTGEAGSDNFDDLPILDPEQFAEQVGGDSELMVEIIDLFLDEGRRQVVEMRESLAAGDWPLLSRVAHTIKGSLGSLHAMRAKAHAQDLETAAKDVTIDVCHRSFAALEEDLKVLEPELLALREASIPI